MRTRILMRGVNQMTRIDSHTQRIIADYRAKVARLEAQMIEMGDELQRVKAENIALRLQLAKEKGK